MDKELKSIAEEYLENVDMVCSLLLHHLDLKDKYELFEYRRIHPMFEFECDGNMYSFHGRGCRFSSSNLKIDWDFGYGSRWCGLDPWFLAKYVKDNVNSLKFSNAEIVKKEFEEAVIKSEMIVKYDLYYFTIPLSETYEPEFPKEFDVLLVEYNGSQWKIERNKIVDRFIQKSRRVSTHIGEGPIVYKMKFFSTGKEVFSIPYDDIGYPEKAVSLFMEIIRNIEK